MAPKKLKNPLPAEPAEPSTASVFDFLYYDATRIASFLSQFDPSGHLTEVIQGELAHRDQQTASTIEAKASVKVLTGSTTLNTNTNTGDSRESRRTYDPRWANALAFLDYIDENKLLNRNLQSGHIGQIALFSGDLALFDLGILRRMWDLPAVKKHIINSAKNSKDNQAYVTLNRQQRRKPPQHKQSKESALPNETELGLELMTVLPHAVQAAVSANDVSVWSSLREANLTIAPSDLFLKHGLTIEGTWNIVGILDALPEEEEDSSSETNLSPSLMKQFIAGYQLGFFGFSIAHLVHAVRPVLGRPKGSYGFTPLLLFRTISA